MGRTMIKGVAHLAETLGLHRSTVSRYRADGVLDPATVSDFRGTVIFDLDKVYQCLNHRPVSAGRPRARRNA